MVKDPVCGMDMDEERAPILTIYKRRMYYFCSQRCFLAFRGDPGKYASFRNVTAGHCDHM